MARIVSPELQKAFGDGFNAAPDAKAPHLYSSRCWEAWALGKYHREHGLQAASPRPSRGHSWVDNEQRTFRFDYQDDGRITLT
ncbi:hypothetical protein [Nitrospirillum amazonense]|uniref:hypothetical protein n=1 Tax=Nitrospirillum amazonense TaxID=28077 RepID=UPI002412CD8F|nr:hypothetical protein [Nitrospirillum amazonense]MDG3444610.1 hypothetical protein [Nitrospirillum amazonense]